MVQIHSPRPFFSLIRAFWFFVYTTVGNFEAVRSTEFNNGIAPSKCFFRRQILNVSNLSLAKMLLGFRIKNLQTAFILIR